MTDLLGDNEHNGFSSLEEWNLLCINLTESDVETLCQAYRRGKLQNLEILNLSSVVLSERIKCKYPGIIDKMLNGLQLY